MLIFCRVGLAQLVRLLVLKLTHSGSNSRFDMCVVFTVNYSVAFTANYSFSERRRPRRQRDAIGDQLHKSQDQVGSVFQNMLIGVGYTYMCL
jgi:hypothetical protein